MKLLKGVLLVFVLGSLPLAASERLDPDLLKSVLRIETPPNRGGHPEIACGFLVRSEPAKGGRVFLVTNKHVIGDWNYSDGDIQAPLPWINVFFYRTVADSSGYTYRATRVSLINSAGRLDASKIVLHPNPRVDVAAIDVTNITENPDEQIAPVVYDRSYFIPFDRIERYQTGIADEVIALGYPFGVRSLRNNYPVAKIAYLSSAPGEELSLPFPTKSRASAFPITVVLEGKLLLVDSLITNGNSGGPVVLMGGVRVRREPKTNQLQFSTEPIPNYVIGIVSAGFPGSGLSIVVSSDYILEVIDAFPRH